MAIKNELDRSNVPAIHLGLVLFIFIVLFILITSLKRGLSDIPSHRMLFFLCYFAGNGGDSPKKRVYLVRFARELKLETGSRARKRIEIL